MHIVVSGKDMTENADYVWQKVPTTAYRANRHKTCD